jgi:hypothetical protein
MRLCVQLDLYGVAEHNNYEHKLMTLSDMLFELLAPYGEVRLGSASPSDEQAFYLTHGETPDSLKVRAAVLSRLKQVVFQAGSLRCRETPARPVTPYPLVKLAGEY